MNILNVEQVHYFDETTEHIEYDMEYFDVMDEYTEEEDNAILGSV
jgi:hypothetical protein